METVARAVMLLFARDGARPSGAFEKAAGAAGAMIRRRVARGGGTVRLGIRLDHDPLAAVARERELRLLDGAIDTDASIVVARACRLVRDDVGPLMLASTGRRRTDVTAEEHSASWLHEHGPMSDPTFGAELLEDEAKFIDHSSIVAAVCRLVEDG